MAPSAIQEQTTNLVSDIKAKLAAVGTDPVKAALSAAEARYVERNPISGKQHEVAVNNLPGGNTRTLLHTSPFPLVMKQGRGPFVWDEDGHKYD